MNKRTTVDGKVYVLIRTPNFATCNGCAGDEPEDAGLCCDLGSCDDGIWVPEEKAVAEGMVKPLRLYAVTITKNGTTTVEAEDEEQAELIAREQEAEGSFYLDIEVEIEEV